MRLGLLCPAPECRQLVPAYSTCQVCRRAAAFPPFSSLLSPHSAVRRAPYLLCVVPPPAAVVAPPPPFLFVHLQLLLLLFFLLPLSSSVSSSCLPPPPADVVVPPHLPSLLLIFHSAALRPHLTPCFLACLLTWPPTRLLLSGPHPTRRLPAVANKASVFHSFHTNGSPFFFISTACLA